MKIQTPSHQIKRSAERSLGHRLYQPDDLIVVCKPYPDECPVVDRPGRGYVFISPLGFWSLGRIRCNGSTQIVVRLMRAPFPQQALVHAHTTPKPAELMVANRWSIIESGTDRVVGCRLLPSSQQARTGCGQDAAEHHQQRRIAGTRIEVGIMLSHDEGRVMVVAQPKL